MIAGERLRLQNRELARLDAVPADVLDELTDRVSDHGLLVAQAIERVDAACVHIVAAHAFVAEQRPVAVEARAQISDLRRLVAVLAAEVDAALDRCQPSR